MRPMLLAVITTAALALGCSSGGSSNDAGTGSGGSGGGSGGTGGMTAASCQTIRLCARDCADDACVQNMCKPMAPAAAQDAFQALSDCTVDPARGNCPSGSHVDDCLCMAQYRQDPPCADLLSACVGDITDVIADLCF
jgi:hypothetical protein